MQEPLNLFPKQYEAKVDADRVRDLLVAECSSEPGKEIILQIRPTADPAELKRRMAPVEELMQILRSGVSFPSLVIADLREAVASLEPAGSYLTEEELAALVALLKSVEALYRFLSATEDKGEQIRYPALNALIGGELLLPQIVRLIEGLLDRFGRIKDSASPKLKELRTERASVERQMSKLTHRQLELAIREGWAEPDAQPTLRDGHLLLPITPSYRRQVPGIVYDESATGKTLFVEPLEVVESNNRLREIDIAERKEIIRILIETADQIRPFITTIAQIYVAIGQVDAFVAIARYAYKIDGVIPIIHPRPYMHWFRARHPILEQALRAQGRELIPLDISLEAPKGRLLLISGPNAGGKSVCLKTCGLLQYMLQCGWPIPVSPDSEAGIFTRLAINIGDDQSIDNDLSTYSSHLAAMRQFCHFAGPTTLLLVDEFGAGTEPELGGAIAESLLKLFNDRESFGIITTHYANLKQFAAEHEGVINGAMCYDRGAMKPLFKLEIGRPGSSFALEIAQRSGLPEEVLAYAKELAGEERLHSERYLQDISRDRNYWHRKREEIRKQGKKQEAVADKYEAALEKLRAERTAIIEAAHKEATQLLNEANARIEGTIRQIKESQAEKETIRQARESLDVYKAQHAAKPVEEKLHTAPLPKRKHKKSERKSVDKPFVPTLESHVRIKGTDIEGVVIEIKGDKATISLGGNIRSTKPLKDLEAAKRTSASPSAKQATSNITDHLHEKRMHFKTELDLRGMRAAEALVAVDYFLDDAVQMGVPQVRLLHGTGTGALRSSIREWLASKPFVKSFRDEDVRFGGTGITIVDL
ncbi:endonuclease MutS2 [Porphyromonas miyakawae]|uniref:Endonuclease MutS2 n=2 Tax=Porphyromonas miyakawae TaxID=3137470 RepID=A0ABQ0E2Y0_9PORP